MRKLDRSVAPPPACLGDYRHGTHTWGDVHGAHKQQIQAHLEKVQGRRCAYCEGPLDALGKHIEHFRKKSRYPALTFAWANLFWSCDQADCCGRFKDHDAGDFDPDEILDPSNDDPDRFFLFRSDGTIAVRRGLSAKDRRRALETLRVFNLDPEHGRLRRMRQQALQTYQAVEPGILAALAEFTREECRAFVAEELERTGDEPFSTVIRHFFEGFFEP